MKTLKRLVGLALLPFVAAQVWTMVDLASAALPSGQWRATWFVAFGAGCALWLLIFILLPRTMWLYVLGHEFTHALAVTLAGGKVSAFRVSSSGGHVETDRVNWWIALSPYFVPIYALIWIGLWVVVDFYYPLVAWQPVLFFGLGLTWAFHATFTLSMLHPRQTDLSREGYLFSGVVIALFNFAFILMLLGLLNHDLRAAGLLFWDHIQASYLWTGREIAGSATWLVQKAHELAK